MKRVVGAALTALAIAWAGSAGAANLIANGDFEAGGGSFQGWQSTPGANVGRYDSFAAYGAYGVGADGANNAAWFDTVSGGAGRFEQLVNLVVGERYTLIFDLAVLGQGWQGLQVNVFGGSSSQPVGWVSRQINQAADNNFATSFTRYEIDFRAQASDVTVAFVQGGTGLGFHAALFDNVSIGPNTSAIPEPASWALMIVGFGAAGVGLRRSRPLVFKPA